MASHRCARVRSGRLRAAGLTAAAVAAGAVPGLGSAAPAAASPAADPVAAARQQVETLYREAEADTEAYDATQERMSALQNLVAGESARAALLRGRLGTLTADLGRLAARQYRDAGADPVMSLIFAASPDAYLERAAVGERFAAIESRRVADVRAAQRDLAEVDHATATALADLDGARERLAAQRAGIEARLNDARDRLASLTAAQRAQVGAALALADGSAVAPGAAPALGSLPAAAASGAAASGADRISMAVRSAFAELGRPYVWGAAGPSQFDCSGLTQYVWAQAGVRLPRTSQEQAYAGSSVPLSAIEPGDLVIYYPGHTHVAIYVGRGLIIHAPRPGAVVKFAPVASMPIAMVVRPTG